MSKLPFEQIKLLRLLNAGRELRIHTGSDSLRPTLVMNGKLSGTTNMKTVTSLLNKKLIKHSQTFDPPYHYYVLTDAGSKAIQELKKTTP